MRVLVAPLMAMAESAGPATRARALASAMSSRGWKTTRTRGFQGDSSRRREPPTHPHAKPSWNAADYRKKDVSACSKAWLEPPGAHNLLR